MMNSTSRYSLAPLLAWVVTGAAIGAGVDLGQSPRQAIDWASIACLANFPLLFMSLLWKYCGQGAVPGGDVGRICSAGLTVYRVSKLDNSRQVLFERARYPAQWGRSETGQ